MAKNFHTLFLLTLFVTNMSIAGVNANQRRVIDEPVGSGSPVVQTKNVPGAQNGGLTWILVDSMNNCYGMLHNMIDPLAYDPFSNSLALIHRANLAYGAGSMELWYNTSPDGLSWSRISSLNAGVPLNSRWPSCAIQGTTGLFVFSAPQTTPSLLGYVIYGMDALNAAAPFAVEDQDDAMYWSSTRIVASDDSPYVWWAVSNDPNPPHTEASVIHVWRTVDYTTVDELDPLPRNLFSTGGLDIGLSYRNSTLYLSGYAEFPGDPGEVSNLYYIKSTDNGDTWTSPAGPNLGTGDWRSLPIIAVSEYDNWESHLAFDAQVDNGGYIHFFGVLGDTDNPTSDRAVVEIFETSSGWDALFVDENLYKSTRTDYNSINQMGYHVGSAASADGSKMAAVWLSAGASGELLPDVWMSQKSSTDEAWSAPVNLTNTPDYAELLLHVAPILRDDGGGKYTLFLARAYESGTTAYPPNDLVSTEIFVASHQLDFGSIPCDAIRFFNAKCNANGAAQAMVRLPNSTEYAGQTVEFQLDDTVYPVELITNGTHTIGRLQVRPAGFGQHTITLVNPSGCYDPVVFNCQVNAASDDPEFDALWAEYDDLFAEQSLTSTIPQETKLIGNYPNPFNPSTTFRYGLSEAGRVRLEIYNMLGQLVKTVADEHQVAGYHEVVWDGRIETGAMAASGIYVYRMTFGAVVETKRMLLIK